MWQNYNEGAPLAQRIMTKQSNCAKLTPSTWTTQRSRVARLAVLRPNLGNLAVFQVGWPFGFFWPFSRSFGRKCFLLAVFENMSILSG